MTSARLFAWTRIESPGQNVSLSLTGCHCVSAARFDSTVPWTETALAGAGSHAFAGAALWAWAPPIASPAAAMMANMRNSERNRGRTTECIEMVIGFPFAMNQLCSMRMRRVKTGDPLLTGPGHNCSKRAHGVIVRRSAARENFSGIGPVPHSSTPDSETSAARSPNESSVTAPSATGARHLPRRERWRRGRRAGAHIRHLATGGRGCRVKVGTRLPRRALVWKCRPA